MKALLRFVTGLVLASAVATLAPSSVAACSCAAMPPEEMLTMSDAAFAGTVVAVQEGAVPVGGKGGGIPQTIYTFEVDGVAAGAIGPEAAVLAGGDSAGCGMSFGVGERWFVFATSDGSMLTTGLCSGNVMLAPDDAPPLPVEPPDPDYQAPDAGIQVPVPLLVGLGGVLLIGGVSFVAFRRDNA
jgi:hypothetical protein